MRKILHIFFTMICMCLLVCGAADLVPKAYAASAMTASDSCVEFIKGVEGFSAYPYYDYSQYTVGYGTKCPSEKYFDYKSNGIPKSEADALLRKELVDVADTINKKLLDKYNLTLTQPQFDALVSFSFNIGTGWITSNSTLKNAILSNANENDMVYAFGLYCTAGGKYLPGLVNRRLCEANMYLNGVYSQNRSNAYGYVYYDANGGSVTYRVQAFVCQSNAVPVEDAARNGDVFLGWYTDLTGGSQVTTLDSTLTGKTLFARWQSSENTGSSDSGSTTIRVTGDIVNIRSGPGTNYGTIKQVRRNEVLTVSHVTHLTNMKWGKVQSGWICLDYTNYDAVINGTGNTDVGNNGAGNTDTGNNGAGNTDDKVNGIPFDDVIIPGNGFTGNGDAEADTSQNNQKVISGIVKVNDFLRIRSGAGTNYSTVGFLLNGNHVNILEQKTVGSMVWGRIASGWVSMDYIVTDTLSAGGNTGSGTQQEPEKEPEQESSGSIGNVEATAIKGKITADALRIRSGAGTANPIVGFYYQNDTVAVSERVLLDSGYWGKTNRGWISMDYVLVDTSNGESTQPSGDGLKTVIADCLRIRNDAGTNHKIVGFLYQGDRVAVSQTKTVDQTLWGKVDKGWICMDYLQ